MGTTAKIRHVGIDHCEKAHVRWSLIGGAALLNIDVHGVLELTKRQYIAIPADKVAFSAKLKVLR